MKSSYFYYVDVYSAPCYLFVGPRDKFYRYIRRPVSYTHLDVYKRQTLTVSNAEQAEFVESDFSVSSNSAVLFNYSALIFDTHRNNECAAHVAHMRFGAFTNVAVIVTRHNVSFHQFIFRKVIFTNIALHFPAPSSAPGKR